MIRHTLAEGWLLLRHRGLVSLFLALALAIPIGLAGGTFAARERSARLLYLGLFVAWGERSTRGLNYYARPVEGRRRYRRVLAVHRTCNQSAYRH